MGRLQRLWPAAQRCFDVALVAAAVGSGTAGYYMNANEDANAKQARLRRESEHSLKMQREREEAVHSSLEKLSVFYDQKLQMLKRKRQEILMLQGQLRSLHSQLRQQSKVAELELDSLKSITQDTGSVKMMQQRAASQHKQLEMEVEELKRLLEQK